MPGRLESKVVVVTGAASGQGRAGAILFAKEGANLALADLDAEGLAETAKLVAREASVDVLVQCFDIGVVENAQPFIDTVVARFGVIDVIYNNAGVMLRASIEATTVDEWDRINAINVKGPFFLVQCALPALRKSDCGVIINVSSMSALVVSREGSTAYSASKGALMALTRAQARELASDNIRVNCLIPGAIDTPMSASAMISIPEEQRPAARVAAMNRNMIKRYGEPEEVAAIAVFLATPEASYITGAMIPVDGGWTAT